MKNAWIGILGVIGCGIALLILQYLTTINLSPRLWFITDDAYPTLNDGLAADGLYLQRIVPKRSTNRHGDDPPQGAMPHWIVYFPKDNVYAFYIRDEQAIYTVDHHGEITQRLALEEREWNAFQLVDPHGFVFGKTHVRDVLDASGDAQEFHRILNARGELSGASWDATFVELYTAASNVIFTHYPDSPKHDEMFYFHIEGQWVKLYGPKHGWRLPTAEAHPRVHIEGAAYGQEYDAKHTAYYLKDPNTHTYATTPHLTDNDLRKGTPRPRNAATFDDEAADSKAEAIRAKAFRKAFYSDEGYYNPGIPIEFYGTGYYQLNLHSKSLKFRTKATRSIFSKMRSDLHLFGPPARYKDKNPIRFLVYNYHVNVNTNQKSGVYIVKGSER